MCHAQKKPKKTLRENFTYMEVSGQMLGTYHYCASVREKNITHIQKYFQKLASSLFFYTQLLVIDSSSDTLTGYENLHGCYAVTTEQLLRSHHDISHQVDNIFHTILLKCILFTRLLLIWTRSERYLRPLSGIPCASGVWRVRNIWLVMTEALLTASSHLIHVFYSVSLHSGLLGARVLLK